jgi:hypothetical protein
MRNLTLTIHFCDISQSFVSATKYANTSSFVNVNVNSSVFNYCNNEKITLTSIPNLNWSLALPRQLKKNDESERTS